MFHGNDTDTTMLRLGTMNMMLHGVENPQISYLDSLSQDNEEADKYTLVFSKSLHLKGHLITIQPQMISFATVKTKRQNCFSCPSSLQTLKPGGRAAVIVP